MPTRRRKRRSRMNPLGWIPREAWALIGKSIVGGLVVAGPAVAVKQGQEASVKLHASNDNTMAALSAVAMLIDQQDAADRRIAALEATVRIMRMQQGRMIAGSPAAMIGPAVPADWLPQPVRRRRLFGIF